MPTVRLERPGIFGPVGVVDTADARRFTIRGVLQGASLLVPSAGDIDRSLAAGPGPVVETRYQLAWFLAGQRHPQGRGLMLGLGGGCGAVGLLHEFPQMRLDAVDVDPVMAAMAREFHPLVGAFERDGRLRIHVATALDFLTSCERTYDFVIVDLVVDGDSLHSLDSQELISGLAETTGECWFRVFGSLPDGDLRPIFEKFAAAGAAANWLYSPVSPVIPLPRTRDWILASGVQDRPDPRGYAPFGDARGPSVRAVREAYRRLASRVVPATRALD